MSDHPFISILTGSDSGSGEALNARWGSAVDMVVISLGQGQMFLPLLDAAKLHTQLGEVLTEQLTQTLTIDPGDTKAVA
ncbi:hypothetical protein [Nocardia lijiangensis]|uniref:hypothetical protein n=1 Tax=Nocardia lijiangensis TaxID=299618 RepID=UPI0008370046|nr:hypothetical protein [Nocardia lijiangensis]